MGKNPIYTVCPLCILVPFFMNRNDYTCVYVHVCVYKVVTITIKKWTYSIPLFLLNI